jgi:serine-type D-Ala-D-Ala carboxypeptidase (penicillin-binding protein 5/6)
MQLHLTAYQRRIFWGTFIAVFTIVVLQHFGIQPAKILSPVPGKEDTIRVINRKLREEKNTFSLKKTTSFIPKTFAGSDYENVNSYAVIDMDSGEVILEKSLERAVPIASLTKVMTAVVALDLAEPDEYFTISYKASRQIPTKIGVIPGEKMNLTELLNAMMLTSANDAAQAINDGIDVKYGEEVFIDAMNEKAKILGLNHSHFENPQGFDDAEHYSSAEDLAVLTHYAITHYTLFAQIVKQDYAFIPKDRNHKQFDLNNWNGLLGVYPNVSGVKIGNTDNAGKTTLVIAERNGKKLLAVLLGAPGILERDLWTAELLDAGFSQTLGLKPVGVTEEQLREKYGTWQYYQ